MIHKSPSPKHGGICLVLASYQETNTREKRQEASMQVRGLRELVAAVLIPKLAHGLFRQFAQPF